MSVITIICLWELSRTGKLQLPSGRFMAASCLDTVEQWLLGWPLVAFEICLTAAYLRSLLNYQRIMLPHSALPGYVECSERELTAYPSFEAVRFEI